VGKQNKKVETPTKKPDGDDDTMLSLNLPGSRCIKHQPHKGVTLHNTVRARHNPVASAPPSALREKTTADIQKKTSHLWAEKNCFPLGIFS
jgi:hypothetical protein